MRLFDLHCDTLTELFDKKENFDENTCHIRRSHYSKFSNYAQICAVFSKVTLSDNLCYRRFFDVITYFEKNGTTFCTDKKSIQSAFERGFPAFILSIEDGRLLSGDIGRLRELYNKGVRVFTPLWSGITCIGGAFDTNEGLSEFGKSAVDECLRLGIIPDISHASEKSSYEIIAAANRAKKAVIASHSNSYSVFAHPRNLKDDAAKEVKNNGGVIGISFAPQHLSSSTASSETVFSHIDRYISLLGEDCICIGGDFDGIDTVPSDITSQDEMYNLHNTLLKHNYSEELTDKLFFKNAMNFIIKNL